VRLSSLLFATAAQQLSINACAFKVWRSSKSEESKNLLTPVTEQQFQFFNIDAFENAMESRLRRSAALLESKYGEPVVRIVASPIGDGRLA